MISNRQQPIDRPTVAAVALLAMCLVCVAHEAVGHGSACLSVGGHIKVLSSSIFRCDRTSTWIDPAGPLGNIACGLLALLARRLFAPQSRTVNLFAMLVTAFSFFWESGYLALSMLRAQGDLYFTARDWLGESGSWWRLLGALVGMLCYWATARWLSRALPKLCGDAASTRRVARTAWVSATAGAAFAAALYMGPGLSNFQDAVLEIGASSLPLLWIQSDADNGQPVAAVLIGRQPTLIAAALLVYAAFAATLGRGLLF